MLRSASNAIAAVIIAAGFIAASALNRGAYEALQRKATQQVIQARRDDCNEAEKIRRRARKRINQERGELPKNLALLHLQVTEHIVELAERKKIEALEEVAPVNCEVYAKRG